MEMFINNFTFNGLIRIKCLRISDRSGYVKRDVQQENSFNDWLS